MAHPLRVRMKQRGRVYLRQCRVYLRQCRIYLHQHQRVCAHRLDRFHVWTQERQGEIHAAPLRIAGPRPTQKPAGGVRCESGLAYEVGMVGVAWIFPAEAGEEHFRVRGQRHGPAVLTSEFVEEGGRGGLLLLEDCAGPGHHGEAQAPILDGPQAVLVGAPLAAPLPVRSRGADNKTTPLLTLP